MTTETLPASQNTLALAVVSDLDVARAQIMRLAADLKTRYVGRDDLIDALIIAQIARAHILVLGPPGTSKSMILEELAALLEPDPSEADLVGVFAYPLTKYTTPDEIFGALDPTEFKAGRYRRQTHGMASEARTLFIDEIGRGSSALRAAFLTLMQRRVFHNGNEVQPTPLDVLCGASNTELTEGEDQALNDRFVLRVAVEYLPSDDLATLLARAATGVYARQTVAPVPLAALRYLQAQVDKTPIPAKLIEQLVELKEDLAEQGITLSDRHWVQVLPLLRAHAVLSGHPQVETGDMSILAHALWLALDSRTAVMKLVNKAARPQEQAFLDLYDAAAACYKKAIAEYTQLIQEARNKPDIAQRNEIRNRAVNVCTEALANIADAKKQRDAMVAQAEASGTMNDRLAKLVSDIDAWKRDLTTRAMDPS